MAKHTQTQTDPGLGSSADSVLLVGYANGLPVIKIPSDVRSWSVDSKTLPKSATDPVLKNEAGGYVFTDERVAPAVVVEVEDIMSREGMHRAIDRYYDACKLIDSAAVIQLPNGQEYRRTWRATADTNIPTAEKPEKVGAKEESVSQCDPYAKHILELLGAEVTLIHKRQMQKQLRDSAEKALSAAGVLVDEAGAAKRKKGREIM